MINCAICKEPLKPGQDIQSNSDEDYFHYKCDIKVFERAKVVLREENESDEDIHDRLLEYNWRQLQKMTEEQINGKG